MSDRVSDEELRRNAKNDRLEEDWHGGKAYGETRYRLDLRDARATITTLRQQLKDARAEIAAAERHRVGQMCTVPECVFAVDSIVPVKAVVVAVNKEDRYVVKVRGECLCVTHQEITPLYNEEEA